MSLHLICFQKGQGMQECVDRKYRDIRITNADIFGKGMQEYMEEIYSILAPGLARILKMSPCAFSQMQEIRLRQGEPMELITSHGAYFLDQGGICCKDKTRGHVVTEKELRQTMELASNYSLYAVEEELRQGYITVRGGHRIGVAGQIVLEKTKVKNIRHITFLNIRLAHQVLGCAATLLPWVMDEEQVRNTLILSAPGGGKTTLLRDLIRQVSEAGLRVGVVDERSEIGASYKGKPQNDLGCRTDVLDGCPKQKGMMMLVRSMSPQVIAVDEIGSQGDVEAVEYVMSCGVRLFATVHGASMDEVKRKPLLGRLVQQKRFERYVLLDRHQAGTIRAIFDERGSTLFCEEDKNVVQDHG